MDKEKYKPSKITKNAGWVFLILALIYPLYISYKGPDQWRWSYNVDTKANMFILVVGLLLLVISYYLSKRGK